MSNETQRRLTTIVAADIAGFSRLVGIDEEGTLATQRDYRSELIEPLLAEHRGRIANTAGDSFLFEFPSAVEAVRCVIAVQDGIAERNQEVAPNQRIEYRIGINVGDVVAEGDDLLGDGVNIAARLENLCLPGSIVLSDSAYQQVRDRLDVTWEDSGEHKVKNIARPVQVWRWSGPAKEITKHTPEIALTLPDKPSIAVLPFDNMSGDGEQEYFSDGITEDIITALSKNRWLFVIARNSSFQFRGSPTDVRQIGKELGVRYLLEGSVRNAGARIRVTAQLIETETGNHIWAERYDRDLADIFDLQDELTEAICVKVNAELANTERSFAQGKSKSDLNAWDHFQRGMWHYYKMPIEFHEARKQILAAVEASPDFAMAHAWLAYLATIGVLNNHFEDRETALEEGMVAAKRAVALDDRDSICHFALGRVFQAKGDYDRAIPALKTSIELNPNSPLGYYGLGTALAYSGRAAEAIEPLNHCFRISPLDPVRSMHFAARAYAYYALGRFDEAVEDGRMAASLSSATFVWPYIVMAAAYAADNKIENAREAITEATRRLPILSVAYLRDVMTGTSSDNEKYLADLIKSGLPEK